jgi:predicted phage baseplate assembly protein
MPLSQLEPILDDRTMEDIYSDLRLRIPRYNKDWTNFNDSDPGITLLQLFAWLSEMMLARMNRIPLKNYIKFLQLLGMELRPAKPATAHLTFFTKANQIAEPVPERAQISAQMSDGGLPVIFETTRALDLIQAPLAVVGVLNNGNLVNVTSANDKPDTKFRPFGWFAGLGSALYFGFDKVEGLAPFPEEMTFRVFLPVSLKPPQPQRTDAPPVQPPVVIVWEYRPKDGADWERLNLFEDETGGFLQEGYIRVEGPQEIELSQETRLGTDPHYWIRARIDSGSYPGGVGPEIDFIRPNTVLAENLVTVRAAILGESTGQPDETFQLPFAPVQPGSLVIHTELNNQTETWNQVQDFLSAGPLATSYTLNATEGSIKFGNGDRGRIPEASALVIADSFRYGGGDRANNAGAGTITSPLTVLSGVDKVKNERPAVGGAKEQSIEDLQATAPAVLKRRDRAITAGDFIAFAKEAGGVVNATAISSAHPDFPGVTVPGAVTVVIVPDTGGTPPLLSSDLIASVCKQLEAHRLITTEVYVKGPDYKEIRVEAFVEAARNASFDSIARNIKQALDTLLNPKTWVFGFDLHPTQIFQQILNVDPVMITSIRALNLYVDGRLREGLDQIVLNPGELVYGGDHLIVVTPAQDR